MEEFFNQNIHIERIDEVDPDYGEIIEMIASGSVSGNMDQENNNGSSNQKRGEAMSYGNNNNKFTTLTTRAPSPNAKSLDVNLRIGGHLQNNRNYGSNSTSAMTFVANIGSSQGVNQGGISTHNNQVYVKNGGINQMSCSVQENSNSNNPASTQHSPVYNNNSTEHSRRNNNNSIQVIKQEPGTVVGNGDCCVPPTSRCIGAMRPIDLIDFSIKSEPSYDSGLRNSCVSQRNSISNSSNYISAAGNNANNVMVNSRSSCMKVEESYQNTVNGDCSYSKPPPSYNSAIARRAHHQPQQQQQQQHSSAYNRYMHQQQTTLISKSVTMSNVNQQREHHSDNDNSAKSLPNSSPCIERPSLLSNSADSSCIGQSSLSHYNNRMYITPRTGNIYTQDSHNNHGNMLGGGVNRGEFLTPQNSSPDCSPPHMTPSQLSPPCSGRALVAQPARLASSTGNISHCLL